MNREQKKREAKKRNRQLGRAAELLNTSTRNMELLQQRNDYWRNLLVASAFARGLGNERPISEILEEAHPALLGINRPSVPPELHAANRAMAGL